MREQLRSGQFKLEDADGPSPLILTKRGLCCSICGGTEPAGENWGVGTPLDAVLTGLLTYRQRHPNKPHEPPVPTNDEED